MSGATGAYGLSLSIHAAILALIIAAGIYMKPAAVTVVIDFSLETGYGELMEAPAPPEPETELEPEPESEPEPPPPPQEPEPEPVVEPVPASEVVATTQAEDAKAAPIEVPEDPEETRLPEPAPVRTAKVRSLRPPIMKPAPANPGPAGPPGPPANTAEVYLKANFAYIRKHIQEKVSYPGVARRFGWEGSVQVLFVVHPDGSISGLKVACSSGREVLDESALNAVRRAAPFPPPPVEAKLIIPVAFRLR